jgi:hypothetical protein
MCESNGTRETEQTTRESITIYQDHLTSEFLICSKKNYSCYNQIDIWTFHQALQPKPEQRIKKEKIISKQSMKIPLAMRK